jgi:hypothetical protein
MCSSPQPSAGRERLCFARLTASSGRRAAKHRHPKNATSRGPLRRWPRIAFSRVRACTGLATHRRSNCLRRPGRRPFQRWDRVRRQQFHLDPYSVVRTLRIFRLRLTTLGAAGERTQPDIDDDRRLRSVLPSGLPRGLQPRLLWLLGRMRAQLQHRARPVGQNRQARARRPSVRHRPPEAGAQVRILLVAHRVICSLRCVTRRIPTFASVASCSLVPPPVPGQARSRCRRDRGCHSAPATNSGSAASAVTGGPMLSPAAGDLPGP